MATYGPAYDEGIMNLTPDQIEALKARIASAETRASIAKIKGDALEEISKEMDGKIDQLKPEPNNPEET
jgi:hypothetical protein